MTGEELKTKAAALREKLDREAREGGYILNPDADMTGFLCEGLVRNIERYGYMACPCRLASGRREEDLDIICPCDYRDPDLAEYGACFCALYVDSDIASGKKEARSVPERRPDEKERAAARAAAKAPSPEKAAQARGAGGMKVWRCKVCGYLCARPEPPLKCPVCKADKDRFEEFAF
ncbi:MAG TPA: ferredoxin-thioredoxin reductase catalytic domain-containing protein [Elusimicrobiales bacterium]|nr:ferredoxin-thioredoxin reductase catalytic domain-containing protein [Elusimicrobiales bacterium]